MRRIILYTTVLLATLLALYLVWQFSFILLLFFFSLFIAAAIQPPVDMLVARGVGRTPALVLFYTLALGLLALVILLAGQPLVDEINRAVNLGLIYYRSTYRAWTEGSAWQMMATRLLPAPLSFDTAEDARIAEWLPVLMNVTRSISSALGALALVLVLSIYWGGDQFRFERLWLSLLPVRRREYARDILRDVQVTVGSYLRSQTIQSVLVAVSVGLGAAVGRFDFPLLLAVVAAVAAFVPLFGGIVTALLAYALASLQGQTLAIGLTLYVLLLFTGLELLLRPRFASKERRSFLLTIVIAVALLDAHGIWGLIVAPPLAAAIEVLIRRSYQWSVTRNTPAVQLEVLEARLQELRLSVETAQNGDVAPELHNLVRRLSDLIDRSREAGPPDGPERAHAESGPKPA